MREEYDVTVFGAGPAGICAAVQSARAGARTLIVEKNGICGGTMTVCGINFPGIFDAWGKRVIGGIGWDLVLETLRETGESLPEKFLSPDSAHEHWRHQIRVNPFVFASLADEWLESAGADILFHSMPASIVRNGDLWDVSVCCKSGLRSFKSAVIVDCTGDANVVSMAGCETISYETCQPGTLSFKISGYSPDRIDYGELEKAYRKAVENGEIREGDMGWTSDFSRTFFYKGGDNCNHIYGINAAGSDGKTRLEIESRKSVMRVFRFLRGRAGFENLRIEPAALECGVRETRVIKGVHTITCEEYVSGRSYEDAVCSAWYQVDLHDKGSGIVTRKLDRGVVPQVPYRALVPQNSEGIIAAGRIISSDRLANSALRVQAVCMATGQAAGAAAAISSATGCRISEVPYAELSKILSDGGALVPGRAADAGPAV